MLDGTIESCTKLSGIKSRINGPRAYTAAENRKSPDYAQAIMRISEVWHDLDPTLVSRSFDHEITLNNLADYSNRLGNLTDR